MTSKVRMLARVAGSAAALAFGMAVVPANAAFVATIDGNDCAGVFGIPAEDCKIPVAYDPNESPVIAKLDFEDAGTVKVWVNSGLWGTLDGSEFSWVVAWDGSEWASTGSWSYTPGAGDPVINWFVAKASAKFNLFSVPSSTGDSFYTPEDKGISHLTFYDTGDEGSVVPLPAAAWLLLSGLAGLGALGRRRKTS